MRVYLNYMRVLSHAPISSAMSKQYDGWLWASGTVSLTRTGTVSRLSA
jgi:hypothetical protein